MIQRFGSIKQNLKMKTLPILKSFTSIFIQFASKLAQMMNDLFNFGPLEEVQTTVNKVGTLM